MVVDFSVEQYVEEAEMNRTELNDLMKANDPFFEQFSAMDDEVYADGAIPKRYKELTGLSISIATRCDECVDFHLGNCIELGISLDEIKDAIKMGVIGGGSITYSQARRAYGNLQDGGLIK